MEGGHLNDNLEQLSLESIAIKDSQDDVWQDITELVDKGTQELSSGQLLKPAYFTLFDAMTSIEVMDPRLDMGMLSKEDHEEIAQWDIQRKLNLHEALWISLQMFRCEMTWHMSASLLQTIYTCNYFTQYSMDQMVGEEESDNPVRDLVLYPILVGTGLCCRYVWNEYGRENVFREEDVHFGAVSPHFFDEYSQSDALRLLDVAQAYLEQKKDDEAAQQLLVLVHVRRHWLQGLAWLSSDDGNERALEELARLQQVEWRISESGQCVRGVFDRKCMRRYPSAAPTKPIELASIEKSYQTLVQMARDLHELLGALEQARSVEHLMYIFQAIAIRSPQPEPFVRSVVMSAFERDGRVRGSESLESFARRAILEVAAAPTKALSAVDGEMARVLADWFRTHCQNGPRQRRIALKYLGMWDAMQAVAEQNDINAYGGDPSQNPFWTSSWIYLMKLLLLEEGMLAGVRLCVYLDYEMPLLFGYLTQVLEAHVAHIDRMLSFVAQKSDQQPRAMQLLRWRASALAQKELCLAEWLIAHACERLNVFVAPWHKHSGSQSALQAALRLDAEPAQRARYALRLRAMSMLGSPSFLNFDGWKATVAQLDECRIADLFEHASAALLRARMALDDGRRHGSSSSDPELAAWEAAHKPVYHAVLANSVSLSKLLQSHVFATAATAELGVTGDAAQRNRLSLLNADLNAAQGMQPTTNKKKLKKIKRERQWRDDVNKLVSDKLQISWSTGKHPDWPIYTFIDP
ncbi:N-alpha-acetyltransferase, non-catalitic subunit [Coemansia brasiliensis]|uniref:N-alpha-acetyltransferase, non-catalitic subunit n=1 Tax=Coemansia brasiliensis TaxID=2650707 RepID=A0A9W8LZN6_9FUNG|nr:N-alpha-acetyltransferase, non-catalitic subunit [Coemansia brasiliensis]